MSILQNALVIYDDTFLQKEQADAYFDKFNATFDFKYNLYNGLKLNRETCVFASPELLHNEIPPIWGDNVTVAPWTDELFELKTMVEDKANKITGKQWIYNIALCNRYKKSKDYIAFHSDNEEFGTTKSIASISLGVPRTFMYRDKNFPVIEKVSLKLTHGSLIYMGENCQELYRHGMKKENLEDLTSDECIKRYDSTRINITFRTFIYE